MDEVLHQIINFTDHAHGTQLRRYSGERYIVHPVRVMKICREYTEDMAVLAAALLHDVLEDTITTKEEIHGFLKNVMIEEKAEETINYVVDLTDTFIKENYPQLNRKTRKSKEVDRLIKIHENAQTIKYADIIDNSLDIAENDVHFASVYLREMHQLLLKMDKGHPELFARSLKTVEQCLKKIKK